jgi:hypothetical protein
MNPVKEAAYMPPPPEEVERRIAEMRQLSFVRQLPAQVVYEPPKDLCPWPGCGYRIGAVRFNLDQQVPPDRQAEYMKAWWVGPGLVAACPHCGNSVLFGVLGKTAVNSLPDGAGELPDNWQSKAHVIVLDD